MFLFYVSSPRLSYCLTSISSSHGHLMMALRKYCFRISHLLLSQTATWQKCHKHQLSSFLSYVIDLYCECEGISRGQGMSFSTILDSHWLTWNHMMPITWQICNETLVTRLALYFPDQKNTTEQVWGVLLTICRLSQAWILIILVVEAVSCCSAASGRGVSQAICHPLMGT